MIREKQNWRTFQNDLKKKAARKKLMKSTLRVLFVVPVLIVACYAISLGIQPSGDKKVAARPEQPVKTVKAEQPPVQENVPPATSQSSFISSLISPDTLNKQDVRRLIRENDLTNISQKNIVLESGSKKLRVSTSIDMELQSFLLSQIERAKKAGRGRPRYLAMVALDPETGKVLSMASYDQKNPSNNTCLSTEYPAASIFKIITASAAIETCGLSPISYLNFTGSRYTLYKRQLDDTSGRYTNTISFKDSFAQSVNPVFGKIGSQFVGKQGLEKYANAFGFNHPITFEAPLPVSPINLTDDPYKLAEIACGFNRDTHLSPLHAALLSGTIVNNGQLIEPTIVEQIVDETGKVIYAGKSIPSRQVIKPETSTVVKELMATTITDGTSRKSFQGFSSDPVLGHLNIGGKTGSIYNNKHDVRFDWFVGFAEDKNGQQKLAISVLVGHEKYIGTKASIYARMTMKHYFGNQFAKNKNQTKELMASNHDNPLQQDIRIR
jgi:cell division protein FtsI/penicillin-binding protein 2